MTTSKRLPWWATITILIAILALAFWLRWTYVQGVSPYVDEYITLRAAQQIIDRGVPLLPTGNFYSHGLLLSYIEAGIMALAGFDPLLARIPVLIIGLLTVALTWRAGYRWFSPLVGLVAAALLALAPEAVTWSGRARMYAPLQFFVLLSVFLYWRCLGAKDRWRDSLAFALCFLCAIFLHAETMILLPVFILVACVASWPALKQQGPLAVLHHWWQKGLIVAWIIAALGVLVELWFRQLGPPMVSRLAAGVYGPSSREYLQVAWDWPGILKTLEPLLTSPAVLGLIGLLFLELIYVLLRRKRSAGPLLPTPWQAPLAYLAAVFGLTLLVLLFVTDPSWKSPRYLFMLLPIFYLSLSAAIFGLAEQIPGLPRRQWVLAGAALLLVLAGSWPTAWAAAREKVAGYDHAFEAVAAQWQPGDAVITFVPQAAIFYLGGSDYLTVPADYRGFAYEQDGRWLEGWDAIPLVDSGEGVARALSAHDRLWLVIDEHRFHSRFSDGFVQAVWDGMDLVWRDQQVMVFRTADPSPSATYQERQIDLGPIELAGYALEADPEPGQDLPITLYWSAQEIPPGVYSAFVHLVDAGGTSWAQDDGPPLGELYPTTSWRPGETVRDRKTVPLPADLPSGLYRLEAGMYDPASPGHSTDRAILDFVRIGTEEGPPADLTPAGAILGEQIQLLGYSLVPAGDGAWTLALAWTAQDQVEKDYDVFVHLVDGTGEIQAQHDGPPGEGFYPTSFWRPGDVVLDQHELRLTADAPAGVYRLLVGLYMPETGERLTTPEGDHVELETWTIP